MNGRNRTHWLLLGALFAAGCVAAFWIVLGRGTPSASNDAPRSRASGEQRGAAPRGTLASAGERAPERAPVEAGSAEDEAAPVSDGESAPVSGLDPFAKAFHRWTLTVSDLEPSSFVESDHSKLKSIQIVVRNAELAASDLRSLYESLGEDDPLRTWAVLGVAYGDELAEEDLGWLEGLASGEPASSGPERLAAIHAVRIASGFDRVGSVEAMQRVAGALVERAEESGREGPTEELDAALRVALAPLDTLDGTSLNVARLERLSRRKGLSDAVAAQCFETLARAGGPDGARAVLSAVARGDPTATGAVASLRDPAPTASLLTWIESGWRDGANVALAGAAVGGLLSTGQDVALETVESLLRPSDALSSEAIERRRQIALEGLASLREKRSRGLVRRAQHLFETWESDPELRSVAEAAFETLGSSTMVRPWMLPPESTCNEIRASLLEALDVLPRESTAYSYALYDLARIARPEDLAFVEASLVPSQNISRATEEILQRRRRR